MEVILTLPDFEPDRVFEFLWADDFQIKVSLGATNVVIECKKEGLVSLATHLLTLAQDDFEDGFALNYTVLDALEEGSIDLTFVKAVIKVDD